jgi:glycosyltransferase involved in cell wall biosynthesis
MPLVSIVIPAYNAEVWVDRALDSVMAQTYRDVEVIVVDDGSSDNTAAVVGRRCGPKVRLIRQKNAGASAARNRGIAEARGAYIGFLDADDELTPNMAASLVGALEAYPLAGAASGAMIMDHGGVRTRMPDEGAILPSGQSSGLLGDFFAAFTTYLWGVACADSVLIRAGTIQAVGAFSEKLHYGEDQELWCRIAGRYPWVFVDCVVACYHQHEVSSRTRQEGWRKTLSFEGVYFGEEDMKRHILPDRWESYRALRRSRVLGFCRERLMYGQTQAVRALLPLIAPLPRTLNGWMLTGLAYLPGPIASAGVRKLPSVMRILQRLGVPWMVKRLKNRSGGGRQ